MILSKKVLSIKNVLALTVVGSLATYGLISACYDIKNAQVPQPLNQQVYHDTIIKESVNLVFYKKGCPYCEAGKKAVADATKTDEHNTFFIDVTQVEGKAIAHKYGVTKAASLVTIRNGSSKIWLYAKQTKDGKFIADSETIHNALESKENNVTEHSTNHSE